MPLAGREPAARQLAHMRWAERRANDGNLASAIAHFGRALEYEDRVLADHASAFGVESDERRYEPAFGSPGVTLRVSIRCSCPDFQVTPAIRHSMMETFDLLYPNLPVKDTKVVSINRWKGPCEVEGQWEGVPRGSEKIYTDTFPSVARKVLKEHGHLGSYDVESYVMEEL